MEWKSDIEIAQSTPMAPITKIAADLGVDEKYIEQYGPYKAKISLDYLRACDKFVAERAHFYEQLKQIPFFHVMPSQANYFLCEVLPPYKASEIVIYMLKQHNILTRDCSLKSGLDPTKQYMRIAVRDHADNTRLVEGLKELAR